MWLRGGAPKDYELPCLTKYQIRHIERHIVKSKDATDFAKKAIIWLLRESDCLRERVAATFFSSVFGEKLVAEVQEGAHDMLSDNGSTFLSHLFGASGSRSGLSHHCGGYVLSESDGKYSYDNKAPGRTIWISHMFYDHDSIILIPPDNIDELISLEDIR